MITSLLLHALRRIDPVRPNAASRAFAAPARPGAPGQSATSTKVDASKSARRLPPRQDDRHKKPALTPAQWSALCSPLLYKPSAAQLDTWTLVQNAASSDPEPLVLSTLNDLLPLYSRSARKGDHAIVKQIVQYCRTHFPTQPRTLAMVNVDPLFFKVMVASEYDAGKLLPKATRAVERWMQAHNPEPEHVAFYLSLVSKYASNSNVAHLVAALKAGARESPAVASALMFLYSRTSSPDLGVQVWDTYVARSPPAVVSAAMAARYCDLLGFHVHSLGDVRSRLASVHAGLASGSPPFTLDLARNANVWTALLEAVIRANLPHMVVPILGDLQVQLRGQVGARKAALTVGTMMKQKQGKDRWSKEVQEEIGREVGEYLRQARSPLGRSACREMVNSRGEMGV